MDRSHRFGPRGSITGLVLALLLAGGAVSAAAASGPEQRANAGRADVERVVFIDYAKPPGPLAQPTASAFATDFRLLGGRPSWEAGSTIRYSVSSAGCLNDCTGAVSAVNDAFDTWQVSELTFTRATTGDPDPCGGTNSVTWQQIDGSLGTLAFTAVCRTLGPIKQIVGFQTVFDAGDIWSDSGASGKFDIQATATHEEGHTVGLDHVNSPRDARLTMYPFITPGDEGFGTLGCGDRLGVNALYGTSLGCAPADVPND
jgi:hypothetical protein